MDAADFQLNLDSKRWTKADDGSLCSEASSLGIKPGERPGSMIVKVDGINYALTSMGWSNDWSDSVNGEMSELLSWSQQSQSKLFTIFND